MFYVVVKRGRLLVSAVMITLVLTACGSSPLQRSLLGGWKFVEAGALRDGVFAPVASGTDCTCSPLRNLELHFSPDGSLTQIGSGPSIHGSYAFVDATHMRMDIPEQPGAMASSTIYEVSISADQLHLRASVDAQIEEQRFHRVQ